MSSSRVDPVKRHGSRYRARRRAVEILFEAEARDVDPVALVAERQQLSQGKDPVVPPVNEYTSTIVAGAAEEIDWLDEVIARYLAEDWDLERLPAVDRAILRVSTWELLFNPEVPTPTAVVEGIELASQFSTTKAAPYINGVLDAIASNLEQLRATEPATEPAAEPATEPAAEPATESAAEPTDDSPTPA